MVLAFWRLQHERQAAAMAEAKPEDKPRLEAAISPVKALERPAPEPEKEAPAPEPKAVQEPSVEAKNSLQEAIEKARSQRRASVKTQRSRSE